MAAINTVSVRHHFLVQYVIYFSKIHMKYINKYELEISESRDNFYLMQSSKTICSELDPGEIAMLDEHIDFIEKHQQTVSIYEEMGHTLRRGVRLNNNELLSPHITMKRFFNKKLPDFKKIVVFAQTYLCFFRTFIAQMDSLNTYTTTYYLYLKSIIIFKEIWRKFFMRALLDYTIMYRILIVLEDQFYYYTAEERQALCACFETDYPLTHLMKMSDWGTFVIEKDFFLTDIFNKMASGISAEATLLKIKKDFAEYIATEDKLFLKKLAKKEEDDSEATRTFPVQLE